MTVIFGPDSFAVGADIDIDDYPSGDPDYAYNAGSGSHCTVKEATDKATAVATSQIVVRCIDAGAPAIQDQEVAADLTLDIESGLVGLAVRYNATTRGYIGVVFAGQADEVRIYEDNGGYALLASVDGGLTSGTWAATFLAEGPADDTDLTLTIGAAAPLTFNDTTAPATGLCGWFFDGSGASQKHIDNFSIDDLTVESGGGGPIGPIGIIDPIYPGFDR
jgi:hypothetical protein